jgi:hypothetical protein
LEVWLQLLIIGLYQVAPGCQVPKGSSINFRAKNNPSAL